MLIASWTVPPPPGLGVSKITMGHSQEEAGLRQFTKKISLGDIAPFPHLIRRQNKREHLGLAEVSEWY